MFDLLGNSSGIRSDFGHNITNALMHLTFFQLRHFARPDAFDNRAYGNGVLYRIDNARNLPDCIGMPPADTLAPESVIGAFGNRAAEI